MLKGKKILITAPGKSMMDEKDRIQSLIEQVDMFIICVNSIPDYITPDLLFISNQKRFHQIKKDYGTSADLADCNLSLFFTGKALSGGCGGSLCPENFYVIHTGAA